MTNISIFSSGLSPRMSDEFLVGSTDKIIEVQQKGYFFLNFGPMR